MYLARELTDQTLPAIGRAFGGRNHTTVLHAYKRTAERIADDPEAFDAVRRLTEALAADARDAAPADRLRRSCAQRAAQPSRPQLARSSRRLCTPSTPLMTMTSS